MILSEDAARLLYADGDAAHDFDHVRRVTRLAARLAQAEGADAEIVRLAALLHDVPARDLAEGEQAERSTHHLAAARFARQWLLQHGLDAIGADAVAHCIEAHRFRVRTVAPQTLEAQCLYDADKLDSIGAIGVARAFAFAGKRNHRLWHTPWRAINDCPPVMVQADTPVHEFVYKLQRVYASLYTESARRIGAQRHTYMIAFFSQLDAEMEELE
jgi:uncharacterized protein